MNVISGERIEPCDARTFTPEAFSPAVRAALRGVDLVMHLITHRCSTQARSFSFSELNMTFRHLPKNIMCSCFVLFHTL